MDIERKLKEALTELQRAKNYIGSDVHLGGNVAYSYQLVQDVERQLQDILRHIKR